MIGTLVLLYSLGRSESNPAHWWARLYVGTHEHKFHCLCPQLSFVCVSQLAHRCGYSEGFAHTSTIAYVRIILLSFKILLPIICIHTDTGLRASMNPASNPLVGAQQAPGVYPGVPVGQWGSHPGPHGQVGGYSATVVPGGVAPYSVIPPTAPSYTAPTKSSKQSKQQVRRCHGRHLHQTH